MNLKNEILIIDDSLATSILIRDFLGKLGYVNVHTCSTGKAGIQKFSELTNANKIPVVLLDFHLPDMEGKGVMENIFNIRPDATIIIETADAKTDEQIKETLRGGAYMYLEKPIRFENLKNIFETLEEEKEILKSNATNDDKVKILSFLKTSTRLSMVRLQEYTELELEPLKKHISQLENEEKIIKIDQIKEIACNDCSSVRIAHNFFCPSCKSSNFKQGKLIEHFKCGNVSVDESYQNNICPKCKKEIKIIGVDYKAIENYYICNDCSDKFPDPAQDYICARCNNRFSIDHAKWITSEGYKIKK